jgi:hypothetical protein
MRKDGTMQIGARLGKYANAEASQASAAISVYRAFGGGFHGV